MKTRDFIVTRRPRLSALTRHPKVDFADYERRLQSMQSAMQAIQQAYLGTRERAVVVLEGWDTAGKGGIVRRLGWALDPRSFKVYPIAAPLPAEQGRHYLQRSRSHWADYERAIEDMLEQTSTRRAPWFLIPANNKPFGRLAAFTILIELLGKGLELKPRPLDPKVAELAKELFDLA